MDDHQQQAWDRTTLHHWRDLVTQHPVAELGLEARTGLFLWDVAPEHPVTREHWWSISGDVSIQELSVDKAAARGFAAGFTYETIAVNPVLHCQWLLKQCEAKGVRKVTAHVASMQDALDRVPGATALINCTGVAAGQLAGDANCFPTRGQTVLVRGQARELVTRRNTLGTEPWEALVIPRPGENVTMLGGCKLAGDWTTEPDNSITTTILERCKPLAPELLNENGEFDVVAVKVGLRPSRTLGPRIEIEELRGDQFVVHNYGHHSAGFEGSMGAARTAVALLTRRLTHGI